MGTNYYLIYKTCEHCGQTPQRKHIGKSSGGWVFQLAVYPDEGIDGLDNWKRIFQDHDFERIENEYGDNVTVGDLLRTITERHHPRGLLRCDPKYGARPGPGTWDCCPAGFS
jgi:hypothetical protein